MSDQCPPIPDEVVTRHKHWLLIDSPNNHESMEAYSRLDIAVGAGRGDVTEDVQVAAAKVIQLSRTDMEQVGGIIVDQQPSGRVNTNGEPVTNVLVDGRPVEYFLASRSSIAAIIRTYTDTAQPLYGWLLDLEESIKSAIRDGVTAYLEKNHTEPEAS
jgi:hypothetical protein